VAVSSSVIREILAFGGSVEQFLPKGVDIKNYLK
jgi:phosphopantetheine adenylyltransferase